MSIQTVRLIQNSTGPNLFLNLFDTATGTAIDLTAATMSMLWRAVNTTALITTTGLTIVGVTPFITGVCMITWGSTALFQPVGTYEGQISIVQGGITTKIFDPLRVYLGAAF